MRDDLKQLVIEFIMRLKKFPARRKKIIVDMMNDEATRIPPTPAGVNDVRDVIASPFLEKPSRMNEANKKIAIESLKELKEIESKMLSSKKDLTR